MLLIKFMDPTSERLEIQLYQGSNNQVFLSYWIGNHLVGEVHMSPEALDILIEKWKKAKDGSDSQ